MSSRMSASSSTTSTRSLRRGTSARAGVGAARWAGMTAFLQGPREADVKLPLDEVEQQLPLLQDHVRRPAGAPHVLVERPQVEVAEAAAVLAHLAEERLAVLGDEQAQ